ncbi:esterase/lipase family protein [Glaciecola petra]|uniref:Alpha/beta hydrolase n=1 Tax=Glaciecola petra TaxID=3075602 RepID=A0ABU2ZND0_9ALTE|nr:alpha/beta hydrolase [Aestuariibacter sp. P117]MDT0594133.1 alpha/beta hydrolase [Aestuariibacter sp. P117]
MTIQHSPPPQCKKPSLLSILLEVRAPFEFAAIGLHAHTLSKAPKGDGRPILLVPGYQASDTSMKPLGTYLHYLGYQVYYSQLGRNKGQVNSDMLRVGRRCEEIAEELNGQSVTLIGWSLGGVLTREAARLYPKSVREIITLGTPIKGGPKFTSIGKQYIALNKIDIDSFEIDVHQRNCIGFDQAVTSIYSKTDGVVGWQASIDTYNPQANNIEVVSSHLGLGVNPQVWKLIAETLHNSRVN